MKESLSDVFGKFAKARCLLMGDVMLDRYLYGSVRRISPEAPVPVLDHKDEKLMLGGAGNVFRNLIAMGGDRHVLMSVTGNDRDSIQIKDLLDDAQGCYLYTEQGRRTTVKTRLISKSQQIVRYDEESTEPLGAQLRERVLADMRGELAHADIVVLSDYGKGFFGGGFMQEIIRLCKSARKPIIIDPKCADYSVYGGADFVKPNRKELSEAAGRPLRAMGDIVGAARALCRENSIGAMIVTLSKEGMVYVPGCGGDAIHSGIKEAPTVFDVSGAGDTALSVLALSIAAGIHMPDALDIANAAAQVVVAKAGTAAARPEDISTYMCGRDAAAPLEKQASPFRAREIVQAWRGRGERVCFTNGCFDLLHYGHISSLMQARELGDRLIVALNSDESVRRNKGAHRPIQGEKTRAAVLSALGCVDLVVVFDDDTALPLVRDLRPDVIAKEGYSLDEWPEARLVREYGGSVAFLKREEGYSTSALIEGIAGLKEEVAV